MGCISKALEASLTNVILSTVSLDELGIGKDESNTKIFYANDENNRIKMRTWHGVAYE
jgi:hypothetical protein